MATSCLMKRIHGFRGSGLGLKRKCSVASFSEEDTSGSEALSDEELELAITSRPSSYFQEWPSKHPRILNPYLISFLQLFEDKVIQDFLWVDSCARLADRYLLAMVYVYFRRAGLPVDAYNKMNFFTALYLANDIEEDDEDEKYEIFPWALGKGWMTQFPEFLNHRDQLWHNMGFRAVVSRRTCEEVIDMVPHHLIWQRKRRPHHGGAIRPYLRSPIPPYGRSSPQYCTSCTQAQVNLTCLQENTTSKLDFIDEIDLSLQDPKEHHQYMALGHVGKTSLYREE